MSASAANSRQAALDEMAPGDPAVGGESGVGAQLVLEAARRFLSALSPDESDTFLERSMGGANSVILAARATQRFVGERGSFVQ